MTSILNNKGLIHLDSQRRREMLRVACRKHSRATQTYSFRTVQRQDTHKHTHTHTHTHNDVHPDILKLHGYRSHSRH